MHYPLILIHESGNRVTNLLLAQAPQRRWVLRQMRDLDEIATAVPPGCPAVIVLELNERGTVLKGMAWLQRHRPEAAVVAVMKCAEPALAHLACDLGARHVVWPAFLPTELHEVIEAFIDRQWHAEEASSGLT